MKRINFLNLRAGQQVIIRTQKGETLRGVLFYKSDWSVGCPVVEASGIRYGIGYEADIVGLPKHK